MSEGLRVFVGYDSREPAAYHVLCHSIHRHASVPVAITPVMSSQLRGLYTRPRGPTESTEFSISRFLVPHLSRYEGFSLFLDCDCLVRDDVAKLFRRAIYAQDKAVHVVKHDYEPSTSVKFLGQTQTRYPRKNWSSVVLFNNRLCGALTPEHVNTANGVDLHRFAWLGDREIGGLEPEWNWLVGEYAFSDRAKILHYTLGGPWFQGYEDCDGAELWRAERDMAMGLCPAEVISNG